MKSSIRIDFIDMGTGKGIEPVIRVEQISSEDPRDTLIQTLFQSLNSEQYLQLRYMLVPTESGKAYPNQNRILLFKPEDEITKITSAAWAFFRQWVIDKKYTKFEVGTLPVEIYYEAKAGSEHIIQS